MHRKPSSLIVAIALFTVAGMAFAQNADQNTGGPTKNTLRLTLVEPAEGATISGSTIRVTVGYNHQAFAAGQGTRFGDANFPQPRFDVYCDNSLKATLKGTESNTATIENVSPGSHKIAIVALNVSGEIIDRKEVGVMTTTAMAESTSSSSSSISTVPAPAAAPPPAPAPRAYEPVSAPPAPAEPALSHTASSSPRLALLGLALVAGGLLHGRKTR